MIVFVNGIGRGRSGLIYGHYIDCVMCKQLRVPDYLLDFSRS